MRLPIALTALLIIPPLAPKAQADAYILGAGRWPCSKVIEVFETGDASEKGQLVGWILGFWSFATATREKAFIDKVEKFGGIPIANLTVAECRRAPPETMLFRVSGSIISNTK